jgi:hypothetical protein
MLIHSLTSLNILVQSIVCFCSDARALFPCNIILCICSCRCWGYCFSSCWTYCSFVWYWSVRLASCVHASCNNSICCFGSPTSLVSGSSSATFRISDQASTIFSCTFSSLHQTWSLSCASYMCAQQIVPSLQSRQISRPPRIFAPTGVWMPWLVQIIVALASVPGR